MGASEARRRVAVIIPCRDDGTLACEAISSLREAEPLELVVVDDGSTEPEAVAATDRLDHDGVRVIRHPRCRGVTAARMSGLAATSAPYVFPLDADDHAVAGALGAMADRLDADREAAVCFGDYIEFGRRRTLRAVPATLDPYRVAYTNEYPISSLYRRSAIEAVGGWRRVSSELDARSDWGMWMSLAERGLRGIHLGPGRPIYERRMHGGRLAAAARRRHRTLYRGLREQHSRLFAELPEHRRRSNLGTVRKLLYPIVYGGRPRWPGEDRVKALLDRAGVWTLRR